MSKNGVPLLKPDVHVDCENDEILLNGERIVYREFIYLMLNKPAGYVSATWDRKLSVVCDLIPEKYRHFEAFPVGRLDIDTEGLLIMTNDGALSHRLLSPKSHVPKTYYAELDFDADDTDIEAFKEGIILDDGYKTMPAELRIIAPKCAEVVILEGKFHQVKRMFEARGKTVTYLKRIKMNNLELDESLPLGEMRELTEEEMGLLCDFRAERNETDK